MPLPPCRLEDSPEGESKAVPTAPTPCHLCHVYDRKHPFAFFLLISMFPLYYKFCILCRRCIEPEICFLSFLKTHARKNIMLDPANMHITCEGPALEGVIYGNSGNQCRENRYAMGNYLISYPFSCRRCTWSCSLSHPFCIASILWARCSTIVPPQSRQ